MSLAEINFPKEMSYKDRLLKLNPLTLVRGSSVWINYSTKWEPNYCEISRDHFEFFDLFFNLFVEERIIILACPGFEPACDPSD